MKRRVYLKADDYKVPKSDTPRVNAAREEPTRDFVNAMARMERELVEIDGQNRRRGEIIQEQRERLAESDAYAEQMLALLRTAQEEWGADRSQVIGEFCCGRAEEKAAWAEFQTWSDKVDALAKTMRDGAVTNPSGPSPRGHPESPVAPSPNPNPSGHIDSRALARESGDAIPAVTNEDSGPVGLGPECTICRRIGDEGLTPEQVVRLTAGAVAHERGEALPYAGRHFPPISAIHLEGGGARAMEVSIEVEGKWLVVIRDGASNIAHTVYPAALIKETHERAAPQPVNHDEALELAYLKREESNLARCYIALRESKITPSSCASQEKP